jgi:hypothetical protein
MNKTETSTGRAFLRRSIGYIALFGGAIWETFIPPTKTTIPKTTFVPF